MGIKKPNKVLIIRLSSLGDVLLSTPLVEALKSRNVGASISFIVRREFMNALSTNKSIDKLLIYERDDKKNSEMIRNLKGENFDLVIDLQNNLRSHAITKQFNCKVVRFKKRRFDKFLLVQFKINRLEDAPSVAVRYASSAGFNASDIGPLAFRLDNDHTARIKTEENFVGMCPGAQHYSKRYPEEYFERLGIMLIRNGFHVALIGGRSDIEICSELSKKIEGSVNLCSDNDLFQTAADISACRAIICNDSGLMHLACAVGVPVLTIFGSSVKEFGFFPYKNQSVILENDGLNCRPCSHIGRENCPQGHFKCMQEITPARVFEALTGLIGQVNINAEC